MTAQPEKKIRNLEDFAGIASDWFWETDSEHRFTYFSSRMEEVTRVPIHVLIGRRRDSIPESGLDDPKWAAHIADLNARRPFRNFEYVMQRAHDNSPLWVRVSGQPLFDDTGDFLGYRGTGHDVTTEMETLQRLEASNRALEDRNRELDDARRAIERTAYADTLTGLPNRRCFERDLGEALGAASGTVGLLHVDLDRFKSVNDTLGHPAGDTVLKAAADRISVVAGADGRVYRVGGDEFLVILANAANADKANWIGDGIVEAMSAPIDFNNQRANVGASVGIALAECGDITPRRLVAHADVALYQVKRSGRNGVCQITAEMRDKMEEHRRLAADLPIALEKREFVPFFQPQVNIVDGTVVGAEALARWQHPELGILSPAAFLHIASELGLVAQIDRLILAEALAMVERLSAKGIRLPSISVNISEARLLDSSLVRDIERLWINRSCKLSIELLETIYFDDASLGDHFDACLRHLRDMGVGIETDDFGSGRASITGLLKVWPDRLKIDRDLVQAVIKDPTKRSMVSAILDMTRALNIDSVAEGVETQADIDAIKALGCTTFQGYAISHPLSEADLGTFLASNRPALANETKTADPRGLPKTA